MNCVLEFKNVAATKSPKRQGSSTTHAKIREKCVNIAEHIMLQTEGREFGVKYLKLGFST